MSPRRTFHPGDPVVYRATKFSAHPGPRAEDIAPSEHGEQYSYLVDKYWVVEEVLPDGQLRLRTRRGKQHILPAADPRLRHANWWERLMRRGRFPQPGGGSE